MLTRASREPVCKLIGLAVLLGGIYGAWVMIDYRAFVTGPLHFGETSLCYEIKPGGTLPMSPGTRVHAALSATPPIYCGWPDLAAPPTA
jgi:hypothetical protein